MTLLDLLEGRVDFLKDKFLKKLTYPVLVNTMGFRQSDLGLIHQQDYELWQHLTDSMNDYSRLSPAEQADLVYSLGYVAFDMLAAADPDPKKTHLQWMISQIFAGNFKLEDLENVQHYLETYMYLKRRWTFPIRERQIQNFKTFGDLITAIRKHIVTPSGKSAPAGYEEEMMKESTVLVNNIDYTVLIPKTLLAAQWFGRDTEWCTAWGGEYGRHPTRSSLWGSYQNGPLYIIRIHGTPDQLYQFHFSSNQFMNVSDQRINMQEFWTNHPTLYDMFMRIRKVGPYSDAETGEVDPRKTMIGRFVLIMHGDIAESSLGYVSVEKQKATEAAQVSTNLHAIFSTDTNFTASINFRYSAGLKEIMSVEDAYGMTQELARDHQREFCAYLNLHDFGISDRWRQAGVIFDEEISEYVTFDDYATEITGIVRPPGSRILMAKKDDKWAVWQNVSRAGEVLSDILIELSGKNTITMENYDSDASCDWMVYVAKDVVDFVKGYNVDVSADIEDYMSEQELTRLVEETPLLASFAALVKLKKYDDFVVKLSGNDTDEITKDDKGNYIVAQYFGNEEGLIEQYGNDEARNAISYVNGDRHFEVHNSDPMEESEFAALYVEAVKADPKVYHYFASGVRKLVDDGDIDEDEFASKEDIDLSEYEESVAAYLNTLDVIPVSTIYNVLVSKDDSWGPLTSFATRLSERAGENDIASHINSAVAKSRFTKVGKDEGDPEGDKWVVLMTAQEIVKAETGHNYDTRYTESRGSWDYLCQRVLEYEDIKIEVDEPYHGWDTSWYISRNNKPEFDEFMDQFNEFDWFD